MADDKTDEEPSIEEILSSIRDIISDEDEDEGANTDGEKSDAAPEVSDVKEEAKPETEAAPVKAEEPAAQNDAPDDDDDVIDLTTLAEEESVQADVETDNVDESETVDQDTTDTVEEKKEEAPQMDNMDDDPLAEIDLDHPMSNDLKVETIETIETDIETDDFDNETQDDGVLDIINDINVADNTMDDKPEKTNQVLVDRVAETATVGAMAKLAENIAISRTSEGVTLEDVVADLLRPMLKDWLDENLPTLIERLVSQELERLAEKAMRK